MFMTSGQWSRCARVWKGPIWDVESQVLVFVGGRLAGSGCSDIQMHGGNMVEVRSGRGLPWPPSRSVLHKKHQSCKETPAEDMKTPVIFSFVDLFGFARF